MNTAPIVKWSGSKRSQAEEIIKRFPREINTYYEPFCGGCSVLYRLLQTPDIRVNRYVASDLNGDLMSLWKEIKDNPDRLIANYIKHWTAFNYSFDNGIGLSKVEHQRALFGHRKEYFSHVRDSYIPGHSPAAFLFIMRTTTNGMPRYNSKGEFNNSCHFSRPGIDPIRLAPILNSWSRVLNEKNVEFVCQSYEEGKPSENDFVYLDPPYFNTKGMYYGKIEFDRYFEWLRSLPCKWAMSFDGRTDKEDLTYAVPSDLYNTHEYLQSGNSSFRRVIGKDRHAKVEESLYLNFCPVRGDSSPRQPTMLQGDLFL